MALGARGQVMADGGGNRLNRGMAATSAPLPQKTIQPVAAPAPIQPTAVPAPAPVSPAGAQSWDEYKGSLDWNNSDVNNGIGGLAKQVGYNGPIQERSGQQVYSHEGESGSVYTDGWKPAAGLEEALKNYRFTAGTDSGDNRSATAYDASGNQVGGDWRTGSSGGTAMKIAGTVIPALVAGGFGAGALGAAGYGPMAAGAGETGSALGEFAQFNPAEFSGVTSVGADVAAGTGADAATSAAWADGAAGLGGDTLSAMVPAAGAGGATSGIAGALAAAKSGLGSVADFAKANPQLAALGASGAATMLNGSGGNPPAIPGSGGGGSGGTSNDALVQALTNKLYGPNGSMSDSFDYSSVPGLKTSAGEPGGFNQQASDAAYSNATRYLDPQIAQQQQALEARLAEQGFVPGTPGYKQAMQNFMDTNQRAYASARDTATTQGFAQGNTEFSQSLSNANLNNSASRESLAQLLAQRNQPLNELNALKGGQQLAYDNQLGQYNADVASKNSTNQALSQLALALGIYLG